jgi:chromosomal replication initiation ATPase DnaA
MQHPELIRYVRWAAEAAGCPVAQMTGRCQNAIVTRARHAAMKEAYLEGFSSVQIGRAFGKDHTSVLYAIRKMGG